MKRKKVVWLYFVVCSLFFISLADAEAAWNDKIALEFGITGVLQSTAGNDTASTDDQIDYGFSADLTLIGELAPGHSLNLVWEAGEGDAAGDNLGARTTPNGDGADSALVTNVTQAFYESEYLEGKLILSVGKYDVHGITDTNEYANDETSQFLNSLFIRSAGLSVPEIGAVPSVAIQVQPVDLLSFVYSYSNSDGEDVGNEAYQQVELGIHPSFGGLSGNYRVGYVKHGASYTDVVDGSAKDNTALFVSVDQAISSNTGVFFRYAKSDENLVENEIKSTTSFGLSSNGAMFGRQDDTMGIAYGKVELNEKVVTSFNEGEKVVEAYYNYTVNENMAITIDAQSFQDLERADNRNVTVIGARMNAAF
tara:strand:+ start:899 stop:1996 length:1098 start_codon:yes stop_codon:yes gene_type:complete